MNDANGSNRRNFLKSAGLLAGAGVLPLSASRIAQAAGIITADSARPQVTEGLQIGDTRYNRAVVWGRTDRPARMLVEYDVSPNFTNAQKIVGPYALDVSDYTARVDLSGLPSDQRIHVRVSFQDLSNQRVLSEPVLGSFNTAPRHARDVRIVWGGDTAGQGWGINESFGGMKMYETMRLRKPDFFVHCGDTIYADGPIAAERTAENGQIWRNVVTPEVAKVAETLGEFRARYRYNMLDANVRRFNSEVPQVWQWDDHEVTNNWSDSKDLFADARYAEKNVPLLIARGTRAFLEYAPLRFSCDEEQRVYRHIPYGPLLDVFVIDMRSYRGPNTFNLQTQPSAETDLLGRAQVEWLKRGLKRSRAVWKVIASDMPLGLVVGDGVDAQGRPRYEAVSNGDGPALGRELELAGLLRDIKRMRIENLMWITADVHYCAAHYYDPNKAQFQDFDPFWEFVAGPLNAGSFGPNRLDNTFGPQVVFQKAPSAPNQSPFAGLQFFGEINIDGRSGALRMDLKDLANQTLFTKVLEAKGQRPRSYADETDDHHD